LGVSVLATAETDRSWESIAATMKQALHTVGAHWRESVPYQGRVLEQAAIDGGPGGSIDVRLREGLLLVNVSTSPGPGYHQRVVELVDVLGETLPGGWLRVADTTGYAEHRDPERLRRAFLRWAVALGERTRPTCSRGHAVSACLGLGQGPADVPTGLVATPTGFRSVAWLDSTRAGLERALAEPARPLDPAAREAFLWWNTVPDAFDWIQLGRSICTSDVIWSAVQGQDAPGQVQTRERAVSYLERGVELDPALPAPVEELKRLYVLLGRHRGAERIEARRSAGQTPFRGGYRQGWIRRPLPGHWNVQVPGWLRAGCDETDGHDVFWDDRMTVHLTTSRLAQSFKPREQVSFHLEQLPAEARSRAQVEFLKGGAIAGYMVTLPYGPDVPGVDTLVSGQVAVGGERATFTVVSRSPEASAMAARLSRSLRPLV
jgi:hypothetical protein